MPVRVLLVSDRADLHDALRDDPGGELYSLERRPPDLIDDSVANEFQVVLIDFDTTPDGVSLGKSLRAANRAIEYIPIAGPERERQAVEALKAGAFDYQVWPPNDVSDFWTLLGRLVKRFGPTSPGSFPRPFGRYILTRKLGEGGMAEIFLAEAPQRTDATPTHLVIKRMHSNLAAEDEFERMFRDEARISGTLVHPNIVRVHDFGRLGEHLYIAMEFIDGRNLEEIRREYQRAFPPAIACWIVADVCAGLHYAHQRLDRDGKPMGIVHRDVNPPNVLISNGGRVAITDFGIAKARHRFYETTAGVLKGKFEYMSPEQAHGRPVDRRADVFSVGLILYELLAGARPFQAPTPIETLFLIQQCEPKPPSTYNPRLGKQLDQIVMKALAKEPGARYSEAAALERDLREFARANGVTSQKAIAAFLRDPGGDESSTGEAVPLHGEPTAAAPAPSRAARAAPPTRTPGVVPGLTPGREPTAATVAKPAPRPGSVKPQAPPRAGSVKPQAPPREVTISEPHVAPRMPVPTVTAPGGPLPVATEPTRSGTGTPTTDILRDIVSSLGADTGSIAAAERPTAERPTVTPTPAAPGVRMGVVPDDSTVSRMTPIPDETSGSSFRLREAPAESTVIRPGGPLLAPLPPAEPSAPEGSGIFRPDVVAAERRRYWLRVGGIAAGVLALVGIAWPIASIVGSHPSPTPYPTATSTAIAVATTAPPAVTATIARPTATPIAIVTLRPTPAATAVAVITPRPTPTSIATPRPTTRPPTPAPTAAAVSSGKPGTLSIWVDGWATVEIDGKSTGVNAPCVGLVVPPGRHVVTLTNGAKVKKDYGVVISGGKETKLTAAF